jgi:hypothetical protein
MFTLFILTFLLASFFTKIHTSLFITKSISLITPPIRKSLIAPPTTQILVSTLLAKWKIVLIFLSFKKNLVKS